MSAKIDAIAQRRAELIARAERQRQETAYYFSQCEKPLRVIDTGWSIYRSIREHPVLISVIGAVLGKLISGRLGFLKHLTVWPSRLATAWQIFSRVRSYFSPQR